MTKIFENQDDIIIQHIPISKWLIGFGSSFVFIFTFYWLIFLYFFNYNFLFGAEAKGLIEFFPIVVSIVVYVVLVFFEINLISTLNTPIILLTINSKTKNLEITTRRLYGSETKRFYYHQIEKFKSYQKNKKPFLALILANQEDIKFEIPIFDKQNSGKLVRKLNKFIKNSKLNGLN